MNKLQTLKILNNNNLAKNSIKMKTQNDKTHNKNLDTFQLTEKKHLHSKLSKKNSVIQDKGFIHEVN